MSFQRLRSPATENRPARFPFGEDLLIRTTAGIAAIWLGAVLAFAADAHGSGIDSVRRVVEAWRRDWQARDLDRYMAHYHPRFRSNGQNRDRWRVRKSRIFKHSGPISITVADLWVVLGKDRAEARFVQLYRCREWQEEGEKTLILVPSRDTWRIVEETWQPMPRDRPSVSMEDHTETANNEGALPEPEEKALRWTIDGESEKVMVDLDRFFIPLTTTIDEGPPRIVIDIRGVAHWTVPASVDVGGRWIRRIRSHLHREPGNRLRIVLDLTETENLDMNQTYDSANHRFSLELFDNPHQSLNTP